MKKIWKYALVAVAVASAFVGVSMVSSQLPAPADQEDFINAAESTINGVVSVKSYATPRQANYGSAFNDPFFEFFFGGEPRQRQQPRDEGKQRQIGLGSGVIITSDGYIVTNNHVIDQAERLEVTLNDNRSFNATVIGTDPTTDLALIKIEAEGLHAIPMGNSEDLRVGEWVLAVGNPFGFTSSVTSGIVSAKARNISAATQSPTRSNIEAYIQTDAALNAGNSGGALVNLKGELVGINTAIYSQTGNYAGCSFAIPTSIVNKVIGDLKEYGTVQRAMLGITFAEVNADLIREKDIKGVNAGLYVHSVSDRSAAKEAGLEEGDIVTALNEHRTTNTAEIQEALAMCSPGQKVKIEYYRNGKRNEKSVTLRNVQGNVEITTAGSMADLGCAFAEPSEETLRQLNISSGVQVRGLEDGLIKSAGIRDGFIIVTINGNRVRSASDVEKIYNSIMKNDDSDKVMFIKGFYPTGKAEYYAVPLEK